MCLIPRMEVICVNNLLSKSVSLYDKKVCDPSNSEYTLTR